MAGRAIILAFAVYASSPSFAQQPPAAANSKDQISVPFVGCESDGQVGPQEAPKGESAAVPISPEAARRLAYYSTADKGGGVLAPRGWYCFGTYGSDGGVLYVSPQPIDSATLSSANWSGFGGPAIELNFQFGGTSGSFTVARIIARVSPNHKAFVDDVIKGFPDTYEFGPYPMDVLAYKSPEVVEYETPANAEGLGTDSSWLKKNKSPIRGVAIVEGETDLLLLSVRLPPGLADLASTVIHEVEREAALNNR